MGTLRTVPFRESFATNPCRFLASFIKFFAAIVDRLLTTCHSS